MNKADTEYIHQGLRQLFASGRSLILVQTFEEDRLETLLGHLANDGSQELMTWGINQGLTKGDQAIPGTADPVAMLSHLLEIDGNPIVLLRDLHHHYTPQVQRGLRDLYYRWRNKGAHAVVSASSRQIPDDLEREMAFLVLEMPSQLELEQVIEESMIDLGFKINLPTHLVGATLKGLTLAEARHALARLAKQELDDREVLDILQEEKRNLIAKVGTLEYIPKVPELHELGGLENLKDWLIKRRDQLVSLDESDREIVPKGMMLMGVSGCGKSLCIKAVSSAWQLPLFRMEMVRVFSGAYGSPEIAFANACRLMEEMAPAVL